MSILLARLIPPKLFPLTSKTPRASSRCPSGGIPCMKILSVDGLFHTKTSGLKTLRRYSPFGRVFRDTYRLVVYRLPQPEQSPGRICNPGRQLSVPGLGSLPLPPLTKVFRRMHGCFMGREEAVEPLNFRALSMTAITAAISHALHRV
jgi:hypothetical protein